MRAPFLALVRPRSAPSKTGTPIEKRFLRRDFGGAVNIGFGRRTVC